ncbi:hypothetical protein SESBI_37583 [Sesbania bispinosa]|nr:hypothetical protein SESBI_37583 [Sesbania bispinosa]
MALARSEKRKAEVIEAMADRQCRRAMVAAAQPNRGRGSTVQPPPVNSRTLPSECQSPSSHHRPPLRVHRAATPIPSLVHRQLSHLMAAPPPTPASSPTVSGRQCHMLLQVAEAASSLSRSADEILHEYDRLLQKRKVRSRWKHKKGSRRRVDDQ